MNQIDPVMAGERLFGVPPSRSRMRILSNQVRSGLAVSLVGVSVALLGAAQASANCTPINEAEMDSMTVDKVTGGIAQFDGSVAPGSEDAYFVPGELIIQFKTNTASSDFKAASVADVALPDGVSLEEAAEGPKPQGMRVMRIVSFSAQSTDALKEQTLNLKKVLESRDDVEYVDLNYILKAQGAAPPNDPCYMLQWHYKTYGARSTTQSPGGINLPAAWRTTTGTKQVTVAVLDTGQLYEHSDISGTNFVRGYDFVDQDDDPTDHGDGTDYHGTHVSGTVGALVSNNAAGAASANWDVNVQPVRVLGPGGSGTILNIVNGILWAAGLPIEGVADNETPVDIINMSLGGPLSCTLVNSLQQAISDAHAKGVLVVASAGNESVDAGSLSPAGCDHVFTVAAGDADGRLTWYSAFGQKVEIMAPGGDLTADLNQDGYRDGVLSSVKGGFAYYQGTSMAAPHVAGVAALVLAIEPNLTPEELGRRLQEGAVPRDAGQCGEPCGAGLLSANLL